MTICELFKSVKYDPEKIKTLIPDCQDGWGGHGD